MSFNVYDDAFGSFATNGVSSGLADYLMPPRGSVNPFQVSGTSGGSFTLALKGDLQPGQPNTLPLAPCGAPTGKLGAPLGYLVYRTYLPTGGNRTSSFPAHARRRRRRAPLPRCPATTGRVATPTPRGESVRKAAKVLANQLGVTPGRRRAQGAEGAPAARFEHGTAAGTTPCRGSACPPSLRFFRAEGSDHQRVLPERRQRLRLRAVPPTPGDCDRRTRQGGHRPAGHESGPVAAADPAAALLVALQQHLSQALARRGQPAGRGSRPVWVRR